MRSGPHVASRRVPPGRSRARAHEASYAGLDKLDQRVGREAGLGRGAWGGRRVRPSCGRAPAHPLAGREL